MTRTLLNPCTTKAAVAALKHSKKTVQMFFNTQASCQGPSRIQLLVLSKASMSQSHNPQQTDSLPGFLLQQHRTASCPALLAFTRGKHHLPHPVPSPAFPTTLCTSEIQPFTALHTATTSTKINSKSHEAVLCTQPPGCSYHCNSFMCLRWSCWQQLSI